MKKFAIAFILTALVCAAGETAADQGKFFLRAMGGASVPFLSNLQSELEFQGTDNAPRTGYSLAVSLGRTFPVDQWSGEVHFSASFNPEFDYRNPSDSFPGHLEHDNFSFILRRNLLPGHTKLVPWVGAGLGLGVTNLINGGGKIEAAEAILTGSIDAAISRNINFAVEAIYYAGLQSKPYKSPFIENVETDVILDSGGNQLEDRYRSLDVRIGITVYLRQKVQEEY